MEREKIESCTAFQGSSCIASGALAEVAKRVKESIDREDMESTLIFDDSTGEIVEIDFRGTVEDVMDRLESKTLKDDSVVALIDKERRNQRKPGRPKLGVVSREVTLLPRHWEWLNMQPGGASVALRKLVEDARHVNINRDKVRHSQEVSFRFISAMAGNLPGFEEAIRALFAGDSDRFNSMIATWPADIIEHARKLSHNALCS